MREPPEDYDPRPGHGNVTMVNGDGRYVLRWIMGIVAATIVILLTIDLQWQINEAATVSAMKAEQASMSAKLDWLIDLAKRTRGM